MQAMPQILQSVGHAVRFVREQWRFVLTIAVMASAAQMLVILGLGPLAIAASSIISAATYAALLGANLHGPQAVPARIARDTFKLWLAMALLALIFFALLFAILLVAMSVLLAPYMDALEAAKSNETQTIAILQQAATERPAIAVFLSIFSGAIVLYLTSRFFLAAPATVDLARVQVFSSWNWTKGAGWLIAAARLIVLTPAYILWLSLHALIGAAFGLGVVNAWDFAQTEALITQTPLRFYALLMISQALQVAIFISLETGLAAALYRAVKAKTTPAAVFE